VQAAYKNATAVAFYSVSWHNIQAFFKDVVGIKPSRNQLHASTSH